MDVPAEAETSFSISASTTGDTPTPTEADLLLIGGRQEVGDQSKTSNLSIDQSEESKRHSSTVSSDFKVPPSPLVPSDVDDDDDEDAKARREVEAVRRFLASAEFEDAKEQSIFRLKQELRWAQEELQLKHFKCERLTSLQQKVDTEIHELTTSLFQEAYNMVNDAQAKRHKTQLLLNETRSQVEVLKEELAILKRKLANCSTPPASAKQPFGRGSPSSADRRLSFSPGSFLSFSRRLEFQPQFSSPPPPPPSSDSNAPPAPVQNTKSRSSESDDEKEIAKQMEFKEIDPRYHSDLCDWRKANHDITSKGHPFLARIYAEDILPCLDFPNNELAAKLLAAVESNAIIIEPFSEAKVTARTCALSQVPRVCSFRFKITESSEEWFYISQLCRNKIASVCDFFTYLRYLSQGLVKCGVYDAYWDIINLRKNMSLARLGLGYMSVCEKI